jgi:hypothetical protein
MRMGRVDMVFCLVLFATDDSLGNQHADFSVMSCRTRERARSRSVEGAVLLAD